MASRASSATSPIDRERRRCRYGRSKCSLCSLPCRWPCPGDVCDGDGLLPAADNSTGERDPGWLLLSVSGDKARSPPPASPLSRFREGTVLDLDPAPDLAGETEDRGLSSMRPFILKPKSEPAPRPATLTYALLSAQRSPAAPAEPEIAARPRARLIDRGCSSARCSIASLALSAVWFATRDRTECSSEYQ